MKFGTGFGGYSYCVSHCLVGDEPITGQFRLSHRHRVADVCGGWDGRCGNCPADGELSGDQGGGGQSGGELEE